MPRITRTVERLPSVVPFVGPEAAERGRGDGFAHDQRLHAADAVDDHPQPERAIRKT